MYIVTFKGTLTLVAALWGSWFKVLDTIKLGYNDSGYNDYGYNDHGYSDHG